MCVCGVCRGRVPGTGRVLLRLHNPFKSRRRKPHSLCLLSGTNRLFYRRTWRIKDAFYSLTHIHFVLNNPFRAAATLPFLIALLSCTIIVFSLSCHRCLRCNLKMYDQGQLFLFSSRAINHNTFLLRTFDYYSLGSMV